MVYTHAAQRQPFFCPLPPPWQQCRTSLSGGLPPRITPVSGGLHPTRDTWRRLAHTHAEGTFVAGPRSLRSTVKAARNGITTHSFDSHPCTEEEGPVCLASPQDPSYPRQVGSGCQRFMFNRWLPAHLLVDVISRLLPYGAYSDAPL